jgi:NAD(P)-dependent dehydrogenase (short-subunit alcohol dehydrogenase family)
LTTEVEVGYVPGVERSSLRDKVALVTGANAGLGYQLSLSLARMGAHVVMACRSLQRAEQARDLLRKEVPAASVTVVPLDLAEPDSIHELGALFGPQVGRLDMLIHNAGVYGVPLARTRAGHELHFATNYLGPFALTGLLLPYFQDSPQSRIVFVGSLAHRMGKLNMDQPDWQEAGYRPMAAYGRSKLALLAYKLELHRRLLQRNSKVVAVSAHPGFAPTDTAKRHAEVDRKGAFGKWMFARIESLLPSVAQAAAPILQAATAEGVRGGEYYGPGGWFEIMGAPTNKARINARAHDAELAQRLWSMAEELTGVRYLSSVNAPTPAGGALGPNDKLSVAEPSRRI